MEIEPYSVEADLSEIDDNDLSSYVMEKLKNDRASKEDFGWVARQEYNEKAYNGYKPKNVTIPWKNAANYPVPLTRTLLDTAHANCMGSIFDDPENTVDVTGIGHEEISKESALESLLNFQIANEIEAYEVMDRAIHLGLLQGTSVVKCIQDAETGMVRWIVTPAENLLLPLDAKG